MFRPGLAALAGILLAAQAALAQPPDGSLVVPVQKLAAAPKVDGALTDWAKAKWTKIKVQPADDKVVAKAVGDAEVELAVAVSGDTLYLAARWRDAVADTDYRPWRWEGSAYKRGEDRDDMLAARFQLDGEYDRCMITEKTYRADVWLWSGGRSNAVGRAENFVHLITADVLEEAAEYKAASGATVYIRKTRKGAPVWQNVKAAKEPTAPTLPSVTALAKEVAEPSDIAAKGRFEGGYWSVEMARKLDTGRDDDVVFAAGRKLQGAIAVFNRSHSENKSVSGLLVFDFSSMK